MGIATGCSVDLTGKVAVVTGCNTGIGLKTAKMLCDAGAHVVMACRSKERAKPALAEVTAAGGSAEIMALDLSDAPTIKAFATAFLKKHDTLDVLVNNAGFEHDGRIQRADGHQARVRDLHGHELLRPLHVDLFVDARVAQIVRRARRRALQRHHVVRVEQVPALREGRV
jgi:NAD(P)-dependent dehydrogenase (short-subunit alcohol dehydrogenase family)